MEKTAAAFMHRCTYLYILFSLTVGFTIGILTLIGQAYLPGSLNSLANLGPVWLVPAFFVSAMGERPWRSMAAGWLSLTGMVWGYYWFESVWNRHDFFIGRWMLVWLLIAVLAGAVFGMAGYLWRHRDHTWHRLGSALLSGVFLADGINMLIHYESYRHMIPVPIAEIAIGALLILVLEKGKRDKIKAYMTLVPVTAIGLIGYTVLFML